MMMMLATLGLAAACAQEPAPKCGCGKDLFGTAIRWEGSPPVAAEKAKREKKLVFAVHVAGEGLRAGALSNAEVGSYLGDHFVSTIQRIPAFSGRARWHGMACYFCAPDGRVLHVVAGPVSAAVLLREAKWVVERVKKGVEEARKAEKPFKVMFRKWHAERLRREHGLVVEPVAFDPPEKSEDDPLTYNDPSGRPILPALPPPPLGGPDVSFRERQAEAAKAEGAWEVRDRRGRPWRLGYQGRVHRLLAAYALLKIERLYAAVFEHVLGGRVRPLPIIVLPPRPGRPTSVCLHCGGPCKNR
jgi:hypothetical protein